MEKHKEHKRGPCAGDFSAGAGSCEIRFDGAMFPVEGFNGTVHQNPYVRVLVMEQTTKVAIVCYEMVNVPADVIAAVKKLVSGCTGVPVGNIWLHATHAITTPHAPDDPVKRKIFVDAMTDAAAAAAEQAAATFRPAKIGVAVGTLDVNANRGVKLGENWYYGRNSSMPSNKKLTVIGFAGLDGTAIAHFISYGIKPTAIDNVELSKGTRRISSDVPGVACRMVEEQFGAPAMFCMPAAGDQIPKETAMFYVPGSDKEAELVELSVSEGIEIVDRLGAEMGRAVINLAGEMTYTESVGAIVAADTAFSWANKNGDGQVTIAVRGLVIGEHIALVGLKPEINAVTEAQLWQNSPYEHTVILSFLDGDQKYMPDATGHDLHTWEWKRSGTAKGSAEQFVKVSVELLEGIRSGEIIGSTVSAEDLCAKDAKEEVQTIRINRIDWYVLDEQEDRRLVISKNVLENRAYHAPGGAVTWENSEIRAYLNGEFYGTFSAQEKEIILESTVKNPSNSQYGVAGGNDTVDKVFLLSLNEAEKYLGAGVELLRGIDISTGEAVWWHLRSPGEAADVNASVNTIGLIDYHGVFDGVKDPAGGVRPAMWISI